MSRTLTAASVLGAALLISGALVLRPGGGSGPDPAQAASRVSNDPGALAEYLRFSGDATVHVRPDTAEVDATATGDGTSSQDALGQASDRMQRVIAALRGLGIADDDLQTSGAYSYEDYDHAGQYHASESLTVTVRDVSRAGKVLQTANAAGADEVSGPSFSVADQRAAYRQALRQAIEDARAKADAAAAQMGVQVSGVVSVSDAQDAPPPIAFRAAASGAGSTPDVPVQPGLLDVDASVVVVFSYAR